MRHALAWMPEPDAIASSLFDPQRHTPVDCGIVLLALTVVEPTRVAWSVVAAVAMNLVLAVNHKPGRYMGT